MSHAVERSSIGTVAVCALALLLSGCGSDMAATPAPHRHTPKPAPQPTSTIGLAVEVTPVPTRAARHPPPTPRPTRFAPPHRPYITLSPNAGEPVSQTIEVRGGRLPRQATLELVWSPAGHRTSAVSRIAYTDRSGALSTQLTIPASPLGVYQVTAEVNYAPVARAPFLIRSAADLVVSLSMNGGDEQATIRGKRFMPGIGLALIAYPMFQGGKIRVIANVKTDRRGRFGYTASTRALPAGQYELRAVSTGQLSAQMAETFFQVDI